MGIALVQVGLTQSVLSELPIGKLHDTLRYDGIKWVTTSNLLNTSVDSNGGYVMIGWDSYDTFTDTYAIPTARTMIKGLSGSNNTQVLHLLNGSSVDILRIRDDGYIGFSINSILDITSKFHMNNGAFLIEGGSTEPYPVPSYLTNGVGIRYMWSPSNLSFRAGELVNQGDYWDELRVGTNTYGYGIDILVESLGSTVTGGKENTIISTSEYSSISGGTSNSIGDISAWSSISGGSSNFVENSEGSYIGGGYVNNILNQSGNSVINGGYNNLIDGYYTLAPISGVITTHLCEYSVINGGTENKILKLSGFSVINGGSLNIIQEFSPNSFIGSGDMNQIRLWSQNSSISGGFSNSISYKSGMSFIAGGWLNKIKWDDYIPIYTPSGLDPLPPNDGHPFDPVTPSLSYLSDPYIYKSYNLILLGYNNLIKGSTFSNIINGDSNQILNSNYTTILSSNNIVATVSDSIYLPKVYFTKNYDSVNNLTLLDRTLMLFNYNWSTINVDAFDYSWIYWENRPILTYKETSTYNNGDSIIWDSLNNEWIVGPAISSISPGTVIGNTLYWDGINWTETSNISNDVGSGVISLSTGFLKIDSLGRILIGNPLAVIPITAIEINSDILSSITSTVNSLSTIISSGNSTINSGLQNSAIIGGSNKTATNSNTVYYGGGMVSNIITTSAVNYTTLPSDYIIICDTSSNIVTVDLMSSPEIGRTYIIKRIGTNNVIVNPSGVITIDGTLTKSILDTYSSVIIIYSGVEWSIISVATFG